MTSPGRGLESLLTDALAELANRSLDLDPSHRARLSALEGRQIQITATLPPPLTERHFALAVTGGRLRFFPHPPERPNVIVRGSPPNLMARLVGGESAAATGLSIDGDETVLAELAAALTAYRPDFGGPLGSLLGRELAQAALGAAELALSTAHSVLQAAGHTAKQEAARSFVDRRQAERFLDELSDLRLRVDRLAARVDVEERHRKAR